MKFVIVTAYRSSAIIQGAQKLNIEHVFLKPIALDQFLASLETMVMENMSSAQFSRQTDMPIVQQI